MSVLSCQNCKTTIKAHESLLDLNSSTYDLMASLVPSNKADKIRNLKENAIIQEESPVNEIKETKTTHNTKIDLKDDMNVAESFVMLGKSQLNPAAFNPNLISLKKPPTPTSKPSLTLRSRQQPTSLSNTMYIPNEDLSQTLLCRQTGLYHQLNVQNQLLDQLNDSSAFQHPLCNSCCLLLTKALTDKLNGLETERNNLKLFNDQILSSKDIEDMKSLNQKVEELKEAEKASIATLYQFEKQLEVLKLEIKELEEESLDLNQQEAEYYQKLNDQNLIQTRLYRERSSADAKYEVDQRQLTFLHKTVVLADLFPISQVDIIGTISGLRLGRVIPNHDTTWPEMNAAWGQAVLALHTVASLANFQFKKYKLAPYGSYSAIEELPTSNNLTKMDLFLPSEPNILRLVLVINYDKAMRAYLDCISQLAIHFKTLDSKFTLPYTIDKDKIDKVYLKYQPRDSIEWTRALRYTLRCLKSLISFSTTLKN